MLADFFFCSNDVGHDSSKTEDKEKRRRRLIYSFFSGHVQTTKLPVNTFKANIKFLKAAEPDAVIFSGSRLMTVPRQNGTQRAARFSAAPCKTEKQRKRWDSRTKHTRPESFMRRENRELLTATGDAFTNNLEVIFQASLRVESAVKKKKRCISMIPICMHKPNETRLYGRTLYAPTSN